ncbi:MAG TPA: hypothetical protein VFY31_03820, partial [Macromonas sp.]|nr:hypothetical protein [Macromonas sp.]
SLCDDSAEPLIPRWAGYACGWSILMVLPDQLLFFFHEGPFAWNGLLGLWVPVIAFAAYFVVTFIVVRQAIQRDRLNA